MVALLTLVMPSPLLPQPPSCCCFCAFQAAQHVFGCLPAAAGYEDKELVVECSQRGLLVQSQGSPPLIDRLFDHSVDHSRAVETFRLV